MNISFWRKVFACFSLCSNQGCTIQHGPYILQLLNPLLMYKAILKTKYPSISNVTQIRWTPLHQRGTKVTAATQYIAFPVCYSSSIHPHSLSLTHSPILIPSLQHTPYRNSKQWKGTVGRGTSAVRFSFTVWDDRDLVDVIEGKTVLGQPLFYPMHHNLKRMWLWIFFSYDQRVTA